MVSLENPLSKKRKLEEGGEGEEGESKSRKLVKELRLWRDEKAKKPNSAIIELNLDAPLPLEWQRCLDIKSGQIHYYNTRTHKRTSRDPTQIPEPSPSSSPMLDLELNLNCEPHRNNQQADDVAEAAGEYQCNDGKARWAKPDADREEMVAAVCMRCHMLVMMCKAVPSCPNCKFVHPAPSQTANSAPSLRPEFRLLCCKD